MSKSRKIKERKASADASEQMRELLNAVNTSQPLPAGGTELILLEVDPHRVHAYWNIDSAPAHGNLPLVLRTYDITDSGSPSGAGQVFDVEVQGQQGRWYLDLWRDDRTFVSEIGYRQPDDSLLVVARSNEVSTPPAEPVGDGALGGHMDPEGRPLLTEYPGDGQSAAPEAVPAPAASDERPAEEPVPAVDEAAAPARSSVPAGIEPVTILDPEFPVPQWNSEPPAAAPAETTVAESEAAPISAAMAAGDAAVAFDEDEFADASPAFAPADAAGDDEPAADENPAFPSAEELAASITENHAALRAFYESAGPEAEPPPAPEPVSRAGEPAAASAGDRPVSPAPEGLPPLEQVVGLSSMENAGKDVLLEVNAELHIYGRAKPGTELTLYGQVVKTRPDGTFSVRRILPHGAVVLPLLHKQK